jgi:hypothetical protein
VLRSARLGLVQGPCRGYDQGAMQGSHLTAQKRRAIRRPDKHPLSGARKLSNSPWRSLIHLIWPFDASGGVPGDESTADCSDGRTVRTLAGDSAGRATQWHKPLPPVTASRRFSASYIRVSKKFGTRPCDRRIADSSMSAWALSETTAVKYDV